MTEASLKTNSYKIRLENLNDFFQVWIKTKYAQNIWRKFWIGSVVLIATMMFFTVPMLSTITADAPDIPGFAPAVTTFMIIFVSLVCCLFTAIFLFVLSPLINYLTQLMIFIISPVSRRENQVEITASKFSKSSGHKHSETEWANIYDVSETCKTILIFANKNCAIIIPKSAFDSSEDADTFSKTSSKHWLLAKDITF
ncbi:YcxB family protein [Asticcacaulis machinosus]|uniref:YcxB family protein n=1 Tax=Asticcacaulis machinosus TaxID=2984211 RepID=A0ABT5HN64_9CAUL|nr:YcxB family protein [Asticcacaulis machinosus]MDC7677607.1 YcxB family protein [Asticcacaulis machinosus]